MDALLGLEDLLDAAGCTPDLVCAQLASIFRVQRTEIGLLFRQGDHLHFLYPAELQLAGSIPLSSSAVAARTAVTRQPELFNRFANVPHHDVFESIRLEGHDKPDPELPKVIQKLMSVPLIGDDDVVVGVVQVSRKGASPASAGPDFTESDLDLLVRAARRVALLMPEMRASNHPRASKLRFGYHAPQKPRPKFLA